MFKLKLCFFRQNYKIISSTKIVKLHFHQNYQIEFSYQIRKSYFLDKIVKSCFFHPKI